MANPAPDFSIGSIIDNWKINSELIHFRQGSIVVPGYICICQGPLCRNSSNPTTKPVNKDELKWHRSRSCRSCANSHRSLDDLGLSGFHGLPNYILKQIEIQPDGCWRWIGKIDYARWKGRITSVVPRFHVPRSGRRLHQQLNSSPAREVYKIVVGNLPNADLRRTCELDLCVSPFHRAPNDFKHTHAEKMFKHHYLTPYLALTDHLKSQGKQPSERDKQHITMRINRFLKVHNKPSAKLQLLLDQIQCAHLTG